MFYRENHDGIAEIVKADAVVTDAETEFGWFNILEALDIAFARGEITSDHVENVECRGLIDGAKISFSLVGPGDVLSHRYWPLR